MALLGGWLCEVTYTNPLLPPPPSFENFFYSNQGGRERGEGVAPPYASDGDFSKICQRMAKAEGFSCTLDTIIMGSFMGLPVNLCIETDIFLHIYLDTIIRGSLCTGIDQFLSTISCLILFLMNLFQGNIFLFLFPFPFFSALLKKKKKIQS